MPHMADELYHLDLTGRRGDDGYHGTDYSHSRAHRGQHGRDGGDGSDGERGQDGGFCRLHLSQNRERDEATLVIDGSYQLPGSSRSELLVWSGSIGRSGELLIQVDGGDGGRGGDAGAGEQGGKGRDGSDATRFSSGSNGGRGKPGGNAGEPGDGGDGGDGGSVELLLGSQDMHLLMLPQISRHGGRAGFPGAQAEGGAGGPGGDGGDSYSWTETKHKTEWYSDSKGNRRSRRVSYTERHRNSGGWDGPRGPAGQDSRTHGRRGDQGLGGLVHYLVTHAELQKELHYTEIYDLRLLAYELQALSNVGVFADGTVEPDQLIGLRDIAIDNVGGMPLPVHQDVHIRCQDNQWFRNEQAAACPRGLAGAGDPHNRNSSSQATLREPDCRFRVASYRVQHVGDRLCRQYPLVPEAWVDVVHRPFKDFDKPRTLTVTYPLAIERPHMWTSLRPGERSRFYFHVHNDSLRSFGSQGDTRRRIRLTLQASDGDLAIDHVVARDQHRQVLDLAGGHSLEVDKLEVDDQCRFACTIHVADDATTFTGRGLRAHLELGRIDDPADIQLIQMQEVTVKVAQGYQRRPESSLLLVTNHSTTPDEVREWQELADRLQLGCDVLDLSYYAALDFSDEGDPGTDQDSGLTLFQQWQDATVVLLDNRFDGPLGDTHASAYCIHRQLLHAAAAYGMSFYVPGSGQELVFERMLFPCVDDPNRSWLHESPEEFLGELHDCLDGNRDDTDSWHQIRIPMRYLFTRPKPKHLQKVALKLQGKLDSKYLDRRYYVSYAWDCEEIPKASHGRMGRVYNLGRIEVRRSLDHSSGSAVSFAVDDARIHETDFITSLANRSALIMALSFDEKLDLFISLVLGNYATDLDEAQADLAEAYRCALLADLADEQVVYRRHALQLRNWHWRHIGGHSADLVPPRLRQICSTPTLGSLPHASIRGRLLQALLADIACLINSQTRWFDYLFPGLRNTAITRSCRLALQDLITRAFNREGRIFYIDGSEAIDSASLNAEQAASSMHARREETDAAIDRLHGRGTIRHQGPDYFRGRDRIAGIVRSTNDSHITIRERICEQGVMDERLAATARQEARVRDRMRQAQKKRQQLLLD